ncbi:Wzz/FepE/Etk N-terminal domain-containing protein [Halomonas sp. M1]|uniref:Wzz/FepE/Etk N-terminal domain-containing protein n=1 Tax=Halomonas sp. M1 TaxID=3035470 RepID=UPI002484EE72|nr:Wzz/FepE/Etk N-terminal domain-containing protein [Halomonas sp. M1]WFE72463.1 Wzz/FepE/Etk N-terminal domain-containing protein [Halomonas sp. M1]
MNQSPPYEPHYNSSQDEITLVDLAKILIKRWKIMLIMFLVVVLGTLTYLMLKERTYEYVSIYQVAEKEPGSALEAPNSVVAKINNLYIGPVTREQRELEALERLPFEVRVTNPGDTLLIRLGSEATAENAGLVMQMHESLLAQVAEDQKERVTMYRSSLEQQLQNAENVLQAAEQSSGERASDQVVNSIKLIADIQQRISQLREGQIVQVSVQSLEATGINRSLMMALALMLGGMVSVMAAFLSQFIALVRESMVKDSS